MKKQKSTFGLVVKTFDLGRSIIIIGVVLMLFLPCLSPANAASIAMNAPDCDECGCPDNLFYLVGWDPWQVLRVYLHNLEFWVRATGLTTIGRGMDFEWFLIYRSTHGPNTAMGNGWTHSYDISITQVVPGDDSKIWLQYKGRKDIYYKQPDGITWVADGFFRIITLNPDGTFTLTCADASEWHFHPLDGSPQAGKISMMGDPHGNEILFFYEDGRLIRIIDTLGGHIHIQYNPAGRIKSVEHENGQELSCDYYDGIEYGGDLHDLKSTSVEGRTTTYYYPYGNLGVINANGQDIANVIYDSEEKVKELHKPGAESFTKFYSTSLLVKEQKSVSTTDTFSPPPLPPDTKVIVNDPAGNVTEYLINAKNETINERKYTGRASRWTATTETENRPTNKLRPDDPNYVETSWRYNADSRPTETRHPNRNITQNVYQFDLDPNAPRLTRGNLRHRIRIPGLLGGDHSTITEQYEYKDDLGTCGCGNSLVTRYIDGNGNETLHDYDDDGNRIRTTHVMPGPEPDIIEEWRYNRYGQKTEHIHPDGRVDLFIYYTDGSKVDYNGDGCVNLFDLAMFCSGWMSTGNRIADIYPAGGDGVVDARDLFDFQLAWLDCVDPNDMNPGYLKHKIVDARNFALTTTYEYDARGQVVRQIDPRGNDSRFLRNQLGWIVRTISPEVVDGSGIRNETDTNYDGMGNVVRTDVQNKDENGILQPNTHFTTIYEYNVLNELVRECTESGSYTGPIGGTVDQPSCDGLPPSEFITKKYEKKYDGETKQNLTRVISGEAVEGRQPDNTVTNVYDERDLLFQVIYASGSSIQSTTQYDYDGNGNLKRTLEGIEDNPRIKLNTYDGYDRLVTSTDPMGNISTYHYDENGNRDSLSTEGELTDVPGSAGNVRLSQSAYIFDAMDRRIRTEIAFFDPNTQMAISDGNSVTETQYSDTSQIIRVTNDNSHATEITYDTANRALTVTDAKGNTLTYDYDLNSNLISATTVEKSDLGNPDETFTTTSTYDGLNRLIKTTDNVGNTHTYAYDSRDNTTDIIDALNHETRYEYDGINRLTRTIRDLDDDGADGDGDDITTGQTWDDTSRLTARIDDNGNTTSYAYDALNRSIRTTYADATQRSAAYDVHDNQRTLIDGNGSVVTSTYDLLNRLTNKAITPGAGVSDDTTFEVYAYDGLSRLVRAEDDDSVVTRSYNSLSNATSKTLNGQTITCVYDGIGNKVSCTYPGGRQIDCAFDELERKRVVSDDGAIATYNYLGPGRVERREYANGTRTDYAYDGITGIPNPPDDFGVKRVVATRHTQIAGGTVIDNRTYAWDPMYKKVQRKDIRVGGPELTHDYQYDSIYRLVHTAVADTGTALLRDEVYRFDGVGNRTEVSGGTNRGTYTMDPTMPVPADFQMNHYTATPSDTRAYDENGNLATIDDGLSTPQNLSFDYLDRLVEYIGAQRHTYAYDAFGRRIARVVDADGSPQETRYFYDRWRVCEEQDASGATQATYVYGLYIDEVLNMHREGQDYYYHTDDLYNVMAVTDSTGAVRERYEYADYGSPVDPTTLAPVGGNPSPLGNPYLFQGRRFDHETGLYYYRLRYYDPVAGRFTVRDKIGIWGDSSNHGNGYAYAGNNPMSRLDPFGLDDEEPGFFDTLVTALEIAVFVLEVATLQLPATPGMEIAADEMAETAPVLGGQAEQAEQLREILRHEGEDVPEPTGYEDLGLGDWFDDFINFWLPYPGSATAEPDVEAERIREYNEDRHSQYCDAHPEYGCTTICEEEYEELDEEARRNIREGDR